MRKGAAEQLGRPSEEIVLKGISISKQFGGLRVLKEVSFGLKKGEILGLIGPNGAGKTTLFNIISGAFRPTEGRVLFNDVDITLLPPHEICRLGIARTFQLVQLFPNMSTLENVMCGALFGRDGSGDLDRARERAIFLLDLVGLSKRDVPAKNLTLHERKLLEIARALAANPGVLLIDEFMGGLNPVEVRVAMAMLRKIRDELGITIFWVEHVMNAVMELADRVMVLHHGDKIAEGSPAEVTGDQQVIGAYLGEKWVG